MLHDAFPLISTPWPRPTRTNLCLPSQMISVSSDSFGLCQLFTDGPARHLQVGTCRERLSATERQQPQSLCRLPLRRPALCCCSRGPPAAAAGNSGWRLRLSAPGKLVGHGFRWTDVLRSRFRDPNTCISTDVGEHWTPLWRRQLIVTSRKVFVK